MLNATESNCTTHCFACYSGVTGFVLTGSLLGLFFVVVIVVGSSVFTVFLRGLGVLGSGISIFEFDKHFVRVSDPHQRYK